MGKGGFELRQIASVAAKARPFTLLGDWALLHLAAIVQHVLAEDIRGDFVDCGVWRGGSSFLMGELLRQAKITDRKVWMFDSFQGLPPPQDKDGEDAFAYAQDTASPLYYDNCRVDLQEVREHSRLLGLEEYCKIVPGWFEDTLPVAGVGDIALLHIDCDWYASVKCCLQYLYDAVVPGGFVILDDYYVWDGCARAVHEFLSDRVERLEQYGVAFFQKAVPVYKYHESGFVPKKFPPFDRFVALLSEDRQTWGQESQTA